MNFFLLLHSPFILHFHLRDGAVILFHPLHLNVSTFPLLILFIVLISRFIILLFLRRRFNTFLDLFLVQLSLQHRQIQFNHSQSNLTVFNTVINHITCFLVNTNQLTLLLSSLSDLCQSDSVLQPMEKASSFLLNYFHHLLQVQQPTHLSATQEHNKGRSPGTKGQ